MESTIKFGSPTSNQSQVIMTRKVYFSVGMEIEVPDDYTGIIENDMNLQIDCNETTFNVDGCKVEAVDFVKWEDADELF